MSKRMYTAPADPKAAKVPAVPRPSSSVLLVSQTNQVLLLHRVKTSSSFPSAHVFPGGNLSATHDGAIPALDAPDRHEDGIAYRLAAIRETFEESGLLLAKDANGSLLGLSNGEREEARKSIHKGEIKFVEWLESKGVKADTDGLIPFTRWVTPINTPKRFTTQMYLYFLPLAGTSSPIDAESSSLLITSGTETETVIPVPTHDGGIEHTAARFLPPAKWLSLARQNRIILFPPQFYLLNLVVPFLSPSGSHPSSQPLSTEELSHQRKLLIEYINDPKVQPSWAQRCISPIIVMMSKKDKRVVLALDKPGPELAASGRKGDADRVVLTSFKKEGPRDVEVRWRKEVFDEEREFEKQQKEKL